MGRGVCGVGPARQGARERGCRGRVHGSGKARGRAKHEASDCRVFPLSPHLPHPRSSFLLAPRWQRGRWNVERPLTLPVLPDLPTTLNPLSPLLSPPHARRSMERSLTDEEINALQERVRTETAEKLKVELR